MADQVHLSSGCSNSDLTSDLRQIRSVKASNSRSRSIISTRSPHRSQFSAWIECFKDEEDVANGKPQSQIDAEIMQEKLDQIQKDKEEKLKTFQTEVSNRVKLITQRRQQAQLDKSIEEWTKETKTICQSALPKRVPTSLRNTCTFRANMSADKIRNIMTGDAYADSSHNLENFIKSVQEIDTKVQMIRKQTHLARAGLISKKADEDVMSLPGGLWGRNEQPVRRDKESEKKERETDLWLENNSREKGEMLNEMWNGFDIEEETKSRSHVTKPDPEFNENQASTNEELEAKEKKKLRFKLPDKDGDNISHQDKTLIRPQSRCASSKNNLMQIKNNFEPKESNQSYWTCRKLFMDFEREKVREALRRKKHKKHIEKLKVEKENERFMIEKEAEVHNEYKDKQIQTEKQMKKNRQMIDRSEKDKKINQLQQKTKETNRYIEALKKLLEQKVAAKGMKLPAICSCGNNILDTHPESCANNCQFYNNPKEYARVITSLIAQIDSKSFCFCFGLSR
eukprot:gene11069-12237_t